MVDPIGSKPGAAVERRLAVVAAATPALAAQRSASEQPDGIATSTLTALSREIAAKPPVDADRVAKLRKAIGDGSYPVLPEAIADRLIALKRDWNADDPA